MMAVRKRSIIGGPLSLKEGDDGNGRLGGGDDGETFLVKENKLIARIYLQGRRGPR